MYYRWACQSSNLLLSHDICSHGCLICGQPTFCLVVGTLLSNYSWISIFELWHISFAWKGLHSTSFSFNLLKEFHTELFDSFSSLCMFLVFVECRGSWSSDKCYTDLKSEKPCYAYAHFTRSNTTSPVIASFTGTLKNNRKIYIFRQTNNRANCLNFLNYLNIWKSWAITNRYSIFFISTNVNISLSQNLHSVMCNSKCVIKIPAQHQKTSLVSMNLAVTAPLRDYFICCCQMFCFPQWQQYCFTWRSLGRVQAKCLGPCVWCCCWAPFTARLCRPSPAGGPQAVQIPAAQAALRAGGGGLLIVRHRTLVCL